MSIHKDTEKELNTKFINWIVFFRSKDEALPIVSKDIKDFIASHFTDNRILKDRMRRLSSYIEHDNQCITSQCSAGRPTEDGGYENKIAGKWYQSRPIDKKPQCDCGLSEILKEQSLLVDKK